MVLDNRALGINRYLGLVFKVGNALGLSCRLGGRIDNEIDIVVGRSIALSRILGHVLTVRGGDGLVRILALGLGAHAQNQVAQARDRALHIGGGLVGVQVSPIHHEGGRRQRADGQRIVGTRKLNLKDALVVLTHARATARDAVGKAGLVHELDRHVLQQVAELGLAHAVLELAA